MNINTVHSISLIHEALTFDSMDPCSQPQKKDKQRLGPNTDDFMNYLKLHEIND